MLDTVISQDQGWTVCMDGSMVYIMDSLTSELIASSAGPSTLQSQVLVKWRSCETVTHSQPGLQIHTDPCLVSKQLLSRENIIALSPCAWGCMDNLSNMWGWQIRFSDKHIKEKKPNILCILVMCWANASRTASVSDHHYSNSYSLFWCLSGGGEHVSVQNHP